MYVPGNTTLISWGAGTRVYYAQMVPFYGSVSTLLSLVVGNVRRRPFLQLGTMAAMTDIKCEVYVLAWKDGL